MPTILRFEHADAIAADLTALVGPALDPLVVGRYAGFVAVAAVCVFEMAIKEIFINFAENKHSILGNVTRDNFERINGRVGYQVVKKDYVAPFGEKYSKKFAKNITMKTAEFLHTDGRDIVSAYGNIVVWRNDFIHGGKSPETATFPEVVRAYHDGKEVIRCLNAAMDR